MRSGGFYINEKSTDTSWDFFTCSFLFIYDYGTVAHSFSEHNVRL